MFDLFLRNKFFDEVYSKKYNLLVLNNIDTMWLDELEIDSLEYLMEQSVLVIDKNNNHAVNYSCAYNLILSLVQLNRCSKRSIELALSSDARFDVFRLFKKPMQLTKYISGANTRDLCSIIKNKHADTEVFHVFDDFRSRSNIADTLNHCLCLNEELVIELKKQKISLQKICNGDLAPFIPIFTNYHELLQADDVLFMISYKENSPIRPTNLYNKLLDYIKQNLQIIISNSDPASAKKLIQNIDLLE